MDHSHHSTGTHQLGPNQNHQLLLINFKLIVCVCVQVDGVLRVNRMLEGELVFMNPVQQTLKKCTLSVSGSGLLKDDLNCRCVSLCVVCGFYSTFS